MGLNFDEKQKRMNIALENIFHFSPLISPWAFYLCWNRMSCCHVRWWEIQSIFSLPTYVEFLIQVKKNYDVLFFIVCSAQPEWKRLPFCVFLEILHFFSSKVPQWLDNNNWKARKRTNFKVRLNTLGQFYEKIEFWPKKSNVTKGFLSLSNSKVNANQSKAHTAFEISITNVDSWQKRHS